VQALNILTFQDVFPGEPVPALENILAEIPSEKVLNCLCYINAQLHLDPYDQRHQKFVLGYLCNMQPAELKQKIGNALDRTFGVQQEQILVFSTHSVLTMITHLLAIGGIQLISPNSSAEESMMSVEEKRQVLIANLVANEYVNKPALVSEGINDYVELICAHFWPNLINTHEHRNRTNFMVEVYKSLDFLDYVSAHPHLEKELAAYFKIDKPGELANFCKGVIYPYVIDGMNKKNASMNYAWELDITTNPVLAKYCLNAMTVNVNPTDETDFNTLRTFPIIKLSDTKYKVSNWNFILNKLTTGLLFDLYYRTGVQKQYEPEPLPEGESKFGDFKTVISSNYAENFFQRLFFEVITNENDIRTIAEDENKNQDFYVRRGNKIILIEFKDALMKRFDTYEKIKKQIDGKLNQPNKGTGQLKKLLDKLESNIGLFEPKDSQTLVPDDIIIYPVIVVTEQLFTIPGAVQYLNTELKKKIGETKYTFKVMPLVLVDQNFFIAAHDAFKFGKADLFTCVEDYYKLDAEANSKPRDINSRDFSFLQGFPQYLAPIIPEFNSSAFDIPGSLASIVASKLDLRRK
jgi:hypothetical protein